MEKFKFIPHTADIKFIAFGKTLNKVFENSILAVSEILSQGKKIKIANKKTSEINGLNDEQVLYNLIEEVIYLLDAKNFIVAKAKIEPGKINKNNKDTKVKKLKVIFYGDNVKNYKELSHIKAATYSEMYIKKRKDSKWEAQAVVDV